MGEKAKHRLKFHRLVFWVSLTVEMNPVDSYENPGFSESNPHPFTNEAPRAFLLCHTLVDV